MELPEGQKPGEGPIPENDTFEDCERAYLSRLVRMHAGNYSRIIAHARMSRSTIYRRIKVLGLEDMVNEVRRG